MKATGANVPPQEANFAPSQSVASWGPSHRFIIINIIRFATRSLSFTMCVYLVLSRRKMAFLFPRRGGALLLPDADDDTAENLFVQSVPRLASPKSGIVGGKRELSTHFPSVPNQTRRPRHSRFMPLRLPKVESELEMERDRE